MLSSLQSEKKRRELNEKLIKYTLILAAAISILTTFGILFSILFEAIEFFQLRSFWYFLTGTIWSPGVANSQFGALPIFAGTFVITIIALLVAIPIGLGSAIYMSEYASPKFRDYLKPILEILAGIPTVVYGFFAAITVAPLVVKAAAFFGLEATFNSALASGIVMGIMIIPLISSLSDDVIRAVPDSQRKAAFALGMTHGETIKNIVIPSAMPGIISASLLALSRALGETMIVVMAAGLRPNLSWNPLEDMTTVTVTIVNSLVGDFEFNSPETLSAFALGLVLFIVTLILNMISLSLIRKFKEKYKVNTL
ncbi:phosphate ABC transporter permease subunit PstC [Aliarcobacter cryaerophilus]|uniref:Phosphate transport system permease protein n=1 Tax=Aliarcobacter cryaerophilus TaxID=28198 RepID=A0A2S9TAM5_9BACT|nr:phosphate ABC transporter permease subunit PstC [Aliarcobacter cryaerophilus]MBP6289375.1 phosphate ABC transporter permease subunit PstC [Aliarcobacter sp.]MBP7251077.1 phosphate ABC transporter permease subunit PstC [Aliarcobacter sp.]PRM95878.1 phosphate ABC transporter permease subunit PstC [Aliarcobacter cryaerophilus]PRM99894.1 phosphate ABC transporter permease subunit PstC [Arcobacter cryaerophilus gv. pseudocryaerophilus]